MSGQFPHFHESHGQNDDRVQHARSIDRSFSKQLFREMAKTEMEDAPLNWRQRKRFVAFATRLGIDEFEAKLILRAVEYECGHAELAALDERQEQAASIKELVYLERDTNHTPVDFATVVVLGVAWIGVAGWFARRFFGE